MSDPVSASAPVGAPTSSTVSEPVSDAGLPPAEGASPPRARDPVSGRFINAQTGALEEAAPPVEPKPKYKLNIDGNEEEWELDRILQSVQLAQASHRRFQEAAEARKAMEAREAKLRQAFAQGRSNPEALLRAMGIDPVSYAEQLISQRVQEESLSPQQREYQQFQREKAQWEAERKREAQTRAQQQQAAATQQHYQNFHSSFQKALDGSGLPASPSNLRRMADMALVDMDAGQQVDAASLAMRLREELHGETSQWLQKLDEDAILKLVGREKLDRIRQREVDALRQAPAGVRPHGISAVAEPQPVASQKTWDELFPKGR